VRRASGALKTLAVGLLEDRERSAIARLGPAHRLAEIELPAVQPGSSIMPGKVNPVIPEAVDMVAAKVIGNDATVTIAALNGNLELNVMMPVIAYALGESIEISASACRVLAEKCVAGIEADRERCRSMRSAACLDHGARARHRLRPRRRGREKSPREPQERARGSPRGEARRSNRARPPARPRSTGARRAKER
jgi:hypothetical protein